MLAARFEEGIAMTSARAVSYRPRFTALIIVGMALAGCGDPAPTTKPTNSDRNGGTGGSRSGGSGGVVRAGGAGGVAVAGAGGAVPGGGGNGGVGGDPDAGGGIAGAGGGQAAEGGAGGEPAQGGAGGTVVDAAPVPDLQTPDLAPAPRCGDGMVDPGEDCDRGSMNETNPYGRGKCSTACKSAPFCGDDITNGSEECDNGQQNSDTATGLGGCTRACKDAPYCGNKVKEPNEECDEGPAGRPVMNGMTGCTRDCKDIPLPSCGDNVTNPPNEECDNGGANNNTAAGPNACTTRCKRPICGDTFQQAGEACDTGKAGTPPKNGVAGCTPDCKLLSCGNKLVDAVGEECDAGSDNEPNDDIYGEKGACNRQCKSIRQFCGDGDVNGVEECDNGIGAGGNLGNAADYSATPLPKRTDGKDVCNSICKIVHFCGDGDFMNAVDKAKGEQCDDGAMNGAPGKCTATCKTPPAAIAKILKVISIDGGPLANSKACDAACFDELSKAGGPTIQIACKSDPAVGDPMKIAYPSTTSFNFGPLGGSLTGTATLTLNIGGSVTTNVRCQGEGGLKDVPGSGSVRTLPDDCAKRAAGIKVVVDNPGSTGCVTLDLAKVEVSVIPPS
jgi:hypothetical protein